MFSRYEKILLFCLAAVQFNHIVDFMIVMPMGPSLMRLFDINPEKFSLLVSSYTLLAGISGFLAAFYVDKFDRKNNLLFMFAGFSIATLLCGFAPNFYWLLFFRSLAGFFGGITNSLVLAIVSDVINYERRGTAMGLISSAFSLASIAGVPFSLFLSHQFSWHAPFIFLGASSLIVLFISIKFIPPVRSHLGETKDTKLSNPFTKILQSPAQIFSILFMFCLMLGHFAIIPFISPSFVANAGIQETDLFWIYLIGGISSMITAPSIGKLSDRFGKAYVFSAALLFSMIPIFLVTHQKVAPLYLVLIVSALFFISAGARMIPAQALISSAAEPTQRGSFLSIVSCVQSLSMALGSWIAGQIVFQDPTTKQLNNYTTVGFFAIIMSLVSLVVFQKIKFLDTKTHRKITYEHH